MAEGEEETSAFRYKYLIKECGQLTFRNIIKNELRDSTLSDFLCNSKNKETILELHDIHVITDEDYSLLYPETGSPCLEDAGFTLLYVLIRTFFCDGSCHDPMWYKGSKPAVNDISRAAHIMRLQNQIQEIDKNGDDFEEDINNDKMINDLKTIFTSLGSRKTFENSFDLSTEIAFNNKNREALQEEFGKWKDMLQHFETGLDLEIDESKPRRFRLYSLLVDGGTRVFRHIFDDKVPPNQLKNILSQANTKAALTYKGKPILNKSQNELLYPSQGSPKSTTFDITLLALLLRNICGFNKGDRCWYAENLLPTDASTIANITRIRELRNEVISHLPQSGNLTEEEFDRLWDRISEILIKLDGGCNVPFENLQSEIDNLKGKPLDPTSEIKLHEWRKSDEKIESKIMIYLQHSHLESSFELSKETVKDVLDDHYFVETEQYKNAKKKLLQTKVIVLNGAPGEGKTTVAKKLLIEVSKNQRYIQLHSYVEWEKVNIESVDAILIDDMFGSGSFDKEEYKKWQKHIPSITAAVKKQRIYVIITSRTYILSEVLEKLFVKGIFSEENIVELSSEKLTDVEKNEILQNHFSQASKERDLFSDIVTTTEHAKIVSAITELKLGAPVHGSLAIGFPECARLFTCNISLYEKGVDFFKEPMSCVKSYMSELLDDDDTLIAFFVLWAQESKSINSLELERPIHEISETIKEPIYKLQYQPKQHIRRIRHILRQHRRGFIQLNESDETFTFSHRVVQDAVGLVSYEINPTAVIEFSDVPFIENFFRVKTTYVVSPLQDCKVTETMSLYLGQARYYQISRRLESIFIKPHSDTLENAASFFSLSLFDNTDFCSAFIESLSDDGSLQSFLKAKVRSFRSMFAKHRFLNQVSNEDTGILGYLIWIKKDICPLMEVCLKNMLILELPIQKELSISLLIAVKCGSCKLVTYLLKNGAEADFHHISLAIVKDREDILKHLFSTTGYISKNNILHKACKLGYDDVVTKLFSKFNDELDLTKSDAEGKSLIENAIIGGNVNIFHKLLKIQKPQKLSIKVGENELPLYHFIVWKQNPGLIDILTKINFLPTQVDLKGRTPFLYAIHVGKFSVIEKLLELSIQSNVQCRPDKDQNTPLYVAVSKAISTGLERSNFHKLALKLSSFGENIHLNNSQRQNALELALAHRLIEIANAILKHGDPYIKENSSLFHHFVKTDNLSCISGLLKCAIDPNTHDKHHRTPYMLANALGKKAIVDLLQKDQRIAEYNIKIGIITP